MEQMVWVIVFVEEGPPGGQLFVGVDGPDFERIANLQAYATKESALLDFPDALVCDLNGLPLKDWRPDLPDSLPLLIPSGVHGRPDPPPAFVRRTREERAALIKDTRGSGWRPFLCRIGLHRWDSPKIGSYVCKRCSKQLG